MTDDVTAQNDALNPAIAASENSTSKKKTRTRKHIVSKDTVLSPIKSATRKIRKYSSEERAHILTQISKATSSGKVTIKTALEKIGISEQTYYNWKKAEAPKSTAATKNQGTDLQDLMALEAENQKLRKELADKLRAENLELKKRLGLS